MGLFGFNAEKKLSKGREQLSKGFYYEARLTFEEVLLHDKVDEALRGQAKTGWREARSAMIAGQLEEAAQHLASGEKEEALGSWRAVIELAGNDLDAGDAPRMIELHGGGEAKILEGLDEIVPETIQPSEEVEEEEFFGESPDEVFEVHLQTQDEAIAERYRSFGPAFRDGYLALQEGKATEALERFSAAAESVAVDPFFRLEKAQALMLARSDEEALGELSAIEFPAECPGEVARKAEEMRAVLLARTGKNEEAIEAARRLFEAAADQDAALFLGELLTENERYEEALRVLKPYSQAGRPQQEIDVALARAHAGAGNTREALDLLEMSVEAYFQGPTSPRGAARFPLVAARDLLSLYVIAGEESEKVRSLAQHLIRQDPESAETYKAQLVAYAKARGEGAAG